MSEIIKKVQIQIVNATSIHRYYKYGICILSSSLILGCATAPPAQEMSDARQSVEAAESIGAEEHAPAALDSAQILLSKAEDDMQAGEFERAQQEALAAREAARQAVAISQAKQVPETKAEIIEPVAVEEPEPEPQPFFYTVKQNDNLWNIAAKTSVYGEPLLWPLIYRANADQINNADTISPGQMLTIDNTPTEQDKEAAIQFATQRGIQSGDQDASYLRQYGLR